MPHWRNDVMPREKQIPSWTREHEVTRVGKCVCDFCGEELWARYYRTVWKSDHLFVRRYHVQCG